MDEYRIKETGEIVDRLGLKKAFPSSSICFTALGELAEPVLKVPKPAPSSNLKRIQRAGTGKDALGNWIQIWEEVDAFNDTEEATKEEQEITYLAAEEEKVLQNESDKAEVELKKIDLDSIRSIREYIAAKEDAPMFLKEYEVDAIEKRKNLK